MKVLAWNCRGIRNGSTVPTLRSFLQGTRPDIIFISETHLTIQASLSLISTFGFDNFHSVGAIGRSGGLWILWNDNIMGSVISSDKNLIHFHIDSWNHLPSWDLLCIYGPPAASDRPAFWERLKTFALTISGPWCCIGDFNAIISSKEKYGGARIRPRDLRHFNSMIQECSLMDLGFAGPAYTWTNCQPAHTHIRERLDRVLADPVWVSIFDHSHVLHLPRLSSDHSPILLNTNKRKPIGRVPFRLVYYKH